MKKQFVIFTLLLLVGVCLCGVPGFKLTSSSTGVKPFTIGFSFKKGTFQQYAALPGAQVIPKTRYPDGSLKFGIISGTVSLTANIPTSFLVYSSTTNLGGNVLTTSDLSSTQVTVLIGAEGYGSVTWTNSDWYNPFQTWVSGPYMSSWIYRKPIGTDPHLVAWIEVRLYVDNSIEVLPWIENGYLGVANPTSKLVTLNFVLGGYERFRMKVDLPSQTRIPLINGTIYSHWLGDQPNVNVKHDVEYLMETEAVPTYLVKETINNFEFKTSFQPMNPGSFVYDNDNMFASGDQSPIGLLPLHDVLYMVSSSNLTYGTVIFGGYSAGRYGIHYRDEKTNRPFRFSSYPTLVASGSASTTNSYTPFISGTKPPTWDVAHSPSVGYMAYLLTGNWYFMEECLFAATFNHLVKADPLWMREGAKGLVISNLGGWQTRSCAWQLRTLAQALSIIPDDDSILQQEFIKVMNYNIDHFHSVYVAQPNNPFGWVEPGEEYSSSMGGQVGAPWQQDWITAAVGYSLSLQLPISEYQRLKWIQFMHWKGQGIVKRLGPSSGFWYINADVYVQQVSSSYIAANAYRTGKADWLSDSKSYELTPSVASKISTSFSWMGSTEGILNGEYMPGERALWGYLHPAIAYAVRWRVPGATSAYERMLKAKNYNLLVDSFKLHPKWSLKPHSGEITTPKWLTGTSVGNIIEIKNTTGAGGSALFAYSGFTVSSDGDLVIAAAGGHSDSSDNRVVRLRLTDDAPIWQMLSEPSSQVQKDVSHYSDGKPSSRHIYQSVHYHYGSNRVILSGCRYSYGNAHSFQNMDAFNLNNNTWDPKDTLKPTTAFGQSVDNKGRILTNILTSFDPITNSFFGNPSSSANTARYPWAFDSMRQQHFGLAYNDGEGYSGGLLVRSTIVAQDTGIETVITFKNNSAFQLWLSAEPSYATMDYDRFNDFFLFYHGKDKDLGNFYIIKPNNSSTIWEMSVIKFSGFQLPPPASGLSGRMKYVERLKGFVLINNVNQNVLFIPTASISNSTTIIIPDDPVKPIVSNQPPSRPTQSTPIKPIASMRSVSTLVNSTSRFVNFSILDLLVVIIMVLGILY